MSPERVSAADNANALTRGAPGVWSLVVRGMRVENFSG